MDAKQNSALTKATGPVLEVRPNAAQQGYPFVGAGRGWPLDAIRFRLGKEDRRPDRVFKGTRWKQFIVPDRTGSFLVEFSSEDLKPGKQSLRASTVSAGVEGHATFAVEERVLPGPDVPREKLNKPFLRGAAFKKQRTGNRRGWAEVVLAERRQLLRDQRIFFKPPVRGRSNWTPLGPAPFSQMGVQMGNSGRIRSIAIDPTTPEVMYVGTASGGLWKSTDSGLSWAPKTDDKFSMAIGAIAIDPSPLNSNVVYAGTGEMVPGTPSNYYYGQGLLKSIDFGETWTELGTTEFDLAEISRIVVNPLNTANLFVSASNGVWESTTAGTSWNQLSSDPCTDIVLVQRTDEQGIDRLIGGFVDAGVKAAVRTAGNWSAFESITVPGAPLGPNVVFGVCRTQPNVIYAAFANPGETLAHISASSDWGGSWEPRTIPNDPRLWGAMYNLVIQPHPANPDTVFVGVVHLHMSTDGGRAHWDQVSGETAGFKAIHDDCHAIAFHPLNNDAFFIGTDGGLSFTPNLCASWKQRNADLATLQLYDLGQHSQYEAILFGGAQDNGAFYYTGAPVWRLQWYEEERSERLGGDAVVTQIDPHDSRYLYHSDPVNNLSAFNRSSDGGISFPDHTPPFEGVGFHRVFSCDPKTAGVVYSGGFELMRSEDRGSLWRAVTGNLGSAIQSIGLHPSDPLVVIAGTEGGKLFRVMGPASGEWNTSTVTSDDISYSGLPGSVGISSIALDSSGAIWATVSNLGRAEGPDEFTIDHVFRLNPGADAWASVSDGLPRINPINAIVIDTSGSNRVFCGGDRGIFEWNASSLGWDPFDEGLPNSPVSKLLIHGPSRKLRAATYGRGVWERALDALNSPDEFLYLRNHFVDSGNEPSADGLAHPYIPERQCWHWQSPDIIVERPSQFSPNLLTNVLDVYDRVTLEPSRRGANRVYVVVHNKGPFPVTDVYVRAFFTGVAAGLPDFPPGFLTDPFSWTPGSADTVWNPVADAFYIPRIEAGTSRLAYWEFVIPESAPHHSCIMAFTTSLQDAFAAGGITDPDELVVQNRRVALRNLFFEETPSSGGSGGGSGAGDTGGGPLPVPPGWAGPFQIDFNGRGKSTVFNASVFCGRVPAGAVLLVAVDKARATDVKPAKVELSEKAKAAAKAHARFAHPKELERYDLSKPIVRDLKPGAVISIADAMIQAGKPVRFACWIFSPDWKKQKRYTVDLVQSLGKKVTGGCTLEIGPLPDTRLPQPHLRR